MVEVYHAQTKEDWIRIVKNAKKRNCHWSSDDNDLLEDMWDENKENSVIYVYPPRSISEKYRGRLKYSSKTWAEKTYENNKGYNLTWKNIIMHPRFITR